MRLFLGIISILLTLSCNNNYTKEVNENQSKSSRETDSILVEKKKISDFVSNKKYYNWRANCSESSKYLCEIAFREDYALYSYHGQCIYYYFTYNIQDSIELLWSYKSDCMIDMEFLEKGNSVKDYPKRGDVFAKYTLLNDSVLIAKYNFKEWVDYINKLKKDSIFPTFFYLRK